MAEGTIVESPRIQRDDSLSVAFWKQAPQQDEALRVKIRLTRIASNKEVLRREWMKDDSALKDMLIMKQAAGTTFPVKDLEAKRLGQLWRKTGTDWGRDEVIAALRLYEQLRGKPISKLADSEVEVLAQRIGRAPTGVYNKLMNLRAIDPRDGRKGLNGGSKVDRAMWGEFFDPEASKLKLGNEVTRARGMLYISISQSDTINEVKDWSRFTFHEALNPHMTTAAVAKNTFSKGAKIAYLAADYAYGRRHAAQLRRAWVPGLSSEL